MTPRIHSVLAALLSLLLPFPQPALADVGSVLTAQGAGLASGEAPTEVQMVSEEVIDGRAAGTDE